MWAKLKTIYHNTLYKVAKKLTYKHYDVKQVMTLESLNIALFANYNVNKASQFILPVIFKDIIVYNKKIDFCIKHIGSKSSISNTWCSYEFDESRLDLFLLNNGCLINVSKEINDFKNKVLELSAMVNGLDKSEDLTDQHNYRMVRRFYNHLIDIVEVLIAFVKE